MLNSVVILNFYALDWKYPFWANLVQKNQVYPHKLKFGTEFNSNFGN